MKDIKARLAVRVLPTGLAVLRILFSLVVLGEVLQLLYFESLVFPGDPGLVDSGVDSAAWLPLWIAALLLLSAGLFTRAAAIVNGVFTYLTFGVTTAFEYHVDYLYSTMALLMLLAPVSSGFSLDALRADLRNPQRAFKDRRLRLVSPAWYFAFALCGIGLIYIDSAFFKWESPMWTRGLGLWLPASLPQNTWLPGALLTPLLNTKWLVLSMGYLTLAFEAVFIFLFWFGWARWPVLIIGLFLHVGIVVMFPIPWFGLAVVALYMSLVPISFWALLAGRIRGSPRARLELDPHQLGAARAAVILRAVDLRGRLELVLTPNSGGELTLCQQGEDTRGVGAFMGGLRLALPACFASLLDTTPAKAAGGRLLARWARQPARPERFARLTQFVAGPGVPAAVMAASLALQSVIILGNGPLANRVLREAGFPKAVAMWRKTARAMTGQTRQTLGLVSHPVFLDSHFRNYEHVVAVVHVAADGVETWLPLIDQNGQAGSYNTGRQWVNWSFRRVGATIKTPRLRKGLVAYTRFWAESQGLALNDLRFVVRMKKVRVVFEWEDGLLERNIQSPWMDVGAVRWKAGRVMVAVEDIESL